MVTRNFQLLQDFNALEFENQRYQVFQQTEAQLKETRKILENAKKKAYGGVNLAEQGKSDGLAGIKAQMPHFAVYWEAWCDGYREYLIGHSDF